MYQLSEKAQKLYELLFTKEFVLEHLKNELDTGIYTSDDVSIAGLKYVNDCMFDIEDDRGIKPRRPRGQVLHGYCSSHMLEALQCLLEYGLDPNAMYNLYSDETDSCNIMSELRYVENGYLAADSLALLLDNGGNPNIRIDGGSLVRDINTDLLYGLNEQMNRARFDCLVRYWMVLVGYGAKLENGQETIDMCPGHDVSELKKHKEFYYGAIYSECSDDHMELCIFNKHTNWEIGRL